MHSVTYAFASQSYCGAYLITGSVNMQATQCAARKQHNNSKPAQYMAFCKQVEGLNALPEDLSFPEHGDNHLHARQNS